MYTSHFSFFKEYTKKTNIKQVSKIHCIMDSGQYIWNKFHKDCCDYNVVKFFDFVVKKFTTLYFLTTKSRNNVVKIFTTKSMNLQLSNYNDLYENRSRCPKKRFAKKKMKRKLIFLRRQNPGQLHPWRVHVRPGLRPRALGGRKEEREDTHTKVAPGLAHIIFVYINLNMTRGDGIQLIASASQAGGPGFDPRSGQNKVRSPSIPLPRLQVAMKRQGSPPPKKGPWGMVQAAAEHPGRPPNKNV